MINLEVLCIAATAGTFLFMIAGFVFAVRQNRKLQTALTEATDALAAADSRLEARLQDAEVERARMETQIRDLEEQARLVSGAPAKSWSNIHRRTQAIRMLKGGSAPDRVATELAVSRGEVDLIRKVQRLTAEQTDFVPQLTRSKEHSISALNG